MKKIITMALCFMCLSAWADDFTAKGMMTLTATSSGTSAKLIFFAAPKFVNGPAYDDGGDTPEIMTGQAMYFYAIGSDNNYAPYADTAFHNVPVAFQGPAGETNFTISFSNWSSVTGKVYKLYDSYENKYIDVVNNTNYDFTIATAGQSYTDRFILEYEYVPGEFKVCTTYDHVELYDNAGTDNIVITNMAGDTVVNVAPVAVFQSIDLSGKDAGHYVLTVNGTQYEFCNKPESNN